ncbi:glycosyltransferase family 2 protein [Yersinia kristensenii]|nr:glycosyltransferase family 2 protein [Yersinia kristensenii]
MYISVVSHNHANIITELNSLGELSKRYSVIITDNTGETKLEEYCMDNGIHYLKNFSRKGFGENNNQNYYYAKGVLNMKDEDYFLVLNPDVLIDIEKLQIALSITQKNNSIASTINLIKREGEFDCNIRKYPTFIDFIESYLFKNNRTIVDKSKLKMDQYVDWASGSFLLIKSGIYNSIGGFDENYFMYCEDLDICKRISSTTGEKILYIHTVNAVHYAAHNNRRLLSKHFFWHARSVFRYCFISKY